VKIAMLHAARDLRIEDWNFDGSQLEDDQIWVETQVTGFKIGTDRGNYEGAEQVPGAPDFPRGVGDSNLGIVKKIGTAVTRFSVGDRVVSRYQHQSEYIARENECIVKVPEGIDAEDAVFAHLYALSALCYHKAHFVPGECVAVVGLGVLGMGAVALGALFGARVVAVGNSELRLPMARQMGAHCALLSDDENLEEKLHEFSRGHGIDLVILTANPWPAYRTAMQVARPNGRVSIVSLPGRGEEPLAFNPLDMNWFYAKGLTLIAVSGLAGDLYPSAEDRFSGERLCAQMLDLMADGKLEPKRLVSHRMHYSEMVEAYEMAYRREKNMLNVVFNWRD
jgi:threonine dehydrogenase-like Zn-dependent dehydrogenase